MIYIKHELTDPPASASGEVKLYGLADNELYWMDSTGKRHKVSGGGASVLPDGTDSRQVLKWNNVTATWQAQVLAYSDLSGNLNSAYITTNTDQTGLSGSKETIGTWTFDASAKSLASETVFKVKKDASNNWLRMRGDGFLAVQKLTNAYGEFGDSIVGNTFSCLGRAFFDTDGVDYNAAISVGHGNVTAGWIITQTGGWDGAGTYASAGTFNGQPYYSFGSYKLFAAQVGAVWYWFINATLIADGPTAYISATARQLSGGDIATWLPSSQTFYLQNGAQTGQTASATYETGGGLLGISTTTIDARNGMKISGNWADGSSLKVPVDGQITNSGTSGSNYASGLYFAGGTAYFKAINSAGDTGFIQLGNNTFNLSLKDLANVLDITSSHFNTNTPSLNWQTTGAYSLNSTGALSLTSGAQINLASATYASYNATTYHKWDSGISGSTAKYQFNGQVHGLSYGMTNALSALTPNTDTSSRIQAGVQDNTVSSLSDGGTKARVIHVQAGASSDGYSHQLGLTDNGNMWMRSGASGGATWGAWKKVWSENNFDPATKANLSGASFTGSVTATTLRAYNSSAPMDRKNFALYNDASGYSYLAYQNDSLNAVSKYMIEFQPSGGVNLLQALSGTSASFTGQVSTAKAFVSGSSGLSTVTGATGNVDISSYGVWYHTATLTGAVTLNMNAGAQAGLKSSVMFQQPATAVSYTLAYTGVTFKLLNSNTSGSSLVIPSTRFTGGAFSKITLEFVSASECWVSVD